MSRRLSSIRFMHLLREHPDPTKTARVLAVWEGIRRTHGAPADQAAPLMPPALDDVLAACPTTRTWATRPRSQIWPESATGRCSWSGSGRRCAARSSPR